MLRPKPLSSGDRVALIAPSSPLSEEKFATSVESIRFLGLEPVIFESCTARHGYLAGKDAGRAHDINEAFADKSIKGIFCLLGGYGTTRLLPMLDYETIKNNPKVFAGYSDITALHIAITQKCGFITFHSPMPTTGYAEMDEFSLKLLKDNLFSDKPLGEVHNPPGELIETIVPGTAAGPVTGGNLNRLLGTSGSVFEVDTKGKILFLEDIGERPYKIDLALTALALAGKFTDCEGVILGTFTDCVETETESLTLRQIFEEVVRPFNKPTILNFRAGHVYPQITFPVGSPVKLDATNGRVIFE